MVTIPAQEAGEYPICLVKKNEMLYSERDLYIFSKEQGARYFPSAYAQMYGLL